MTPMHWGGHGLLGAAVRYDDIERSMRQGVRVLEVETGSVADLLGLVAFKDYIIGTNKGLIRDVSDLNDALEELQVTKEDGCLLVYNTQAEALRFTSSVAEKMNRGPQRGLGCAVGVGIIHHIPPVRGAADHDSSGSPSPATYAVSRFPTTAPPSDSISAPTGADKPLPSTSPFPKPGVIFPVQTPAAARVPDCYAATRG
eukprot:Polyplicarium_translucidae@DN1674_c0_g1_i1.p1